MKHYYVYILASTKNGVLYTGVTNNVVRRTREHQDGQCKGFTKKYWVKKLVYYELWESITDAINREKQIKKRNRQRKIDLIEKENPNWNDLSDRFIEM